METKRVEDIQELIDKINQFDNHYIFRGQSDSSFKLTPTIERVLGAKFDAKTVKTYEEYSKKMFQSKFCNFSSGTKAPKSELEWLALMQHYGVPTRLLDFSYSPYIALYFCLENYNFQKAQDFALYAIDYRSLLRKSITKIKSRDKNFDYNYTDTFFEQDNIFDEYFSEKSYDILWITEPLEANQRLERQAGCFLLSCNYGKNIEELLNSELYNGTEFTKIEIPYCMYEQIYSLGRYPISCRHC